MQTPSESLKDARESFDKVFFYPLDKLKERYENSDYDLSDSILFSPLSKLKEKISESPSTSFTHYNDDEYINAESALGRTLFGPIPVGHQREFFREKKNIWIWYEKWQENGIDRNITIRYEVREDGVYKKPLGKGYTRIEGAELENFRRALHAYLKICKEKLY